MDVYDRIEPNIRDAKTNAMDQDIMLSIAISLKRIADVMDKKIVMPELTPEETERLHKEWVNMGGSL